MGWFSKIFSGGVAEVTDSVTNGLDKLFTSDEERLQWEAKKSEVRANLEIKITELEAQVESHIQEQLTTRHANDMQSDSWLSKNIRPLSFIFVNTLVLLVVVLAYFGLALEAPLVALVGSAWKLMLMFYFGGRSIEKGVKMIVGAMRR